MDTSVRMRPNNNTPSRAQHVVEQEGFVRLSYWTVASIIAGLPLASFISVIGLCYIVNFESCVSTHCNVANYFPTISAAISVSPQRYIWRVGIALHTAPRILVIGIYYNYFTEIGMPHPVRWYIKLCRTAFTLQLVEILSLLGLTMVASREYKPAHEIFFVTFIMSSLLYMIAMNLQYYLSRKKLWNAFTLEEQKHQKRLLGLFIFNITCFFVSMYFFYRHNRYCEPGVYSIYALVESIIIVSNITFHVAESAMFTKKEIVFGTESLKSPPKSD